MLLNDKWQRYFMDIAFAVSKGSLDPSIKHGAVIYRPDRSIASTGFNGLPRGIPDTEANLTDRDRKYPRIVHSECNAIYHSRECLTGYGLVVTGSPCSRCALAIIATGIKTVYMAPDRPDFAIRWKDEIELARTLFEEAGVHISYVSES